jgi:hypothetical protein
VILDQIDVSARSKLSKCEAVVVGDVSSVREMATVADRVNELERFDAIIHNVAIGNQEPHRIETVDGLSHVFAIEEVAPYVLTARIERCPSPGVFSAPVCRPAATPTSKTYSGRSAARGGVEVGAGLSDLVPARGGARAQAAKLRTSVSMSPASLVLLLRVNYCRWRRTPRFPSVRLWQDRRGESAHWPSAFRAAIQCLSR